MQSLRPITSVESPREILAADFKSLRGGLPIRGGWGYTKADACIIDKNDPLVDASLPFNGVDVEYVFVEKRIYEEMIIVRPDGEKFSGIKWNLLKQNLINDAGRYFDQLIFEITAFSDSDWDNLKEEFEGPQGFGHPDFDADAHEKKRQEKMVLITREFWFDITSFIGQGVVVTDEITGKKRLIPPEEFEFTDEFKKKIESETTNKELCNSKLLDPAKGLFSTLGLVTFSLGGPYLWVGEDYDSDTVHGSFHYAFEQDDPNEDKLSVASILVADATHDPTEPDISALSQADVKAIDDFLSEDARKILPGDGRKLIRWMSSKLQQSGNDKYLTSQYIVMDQGQEHLCTALRIKAKDRKVVIIGEFVVSKMETLGPLVRKIMSSIDI